MMRDLISWHGATNPAGDSLVHVRFASGFTGTGIASRLCWSDAECEADEIVAYAVQVETVGPS